VQSTSLPTGTVAFLFSDIEGSTRRWEAYGDAMRDALRRHDEILRSEIERRRGYVFKTIGDAFCAAFWSVGEALESAVEAQRKLGRESFGDVEGILVRMAIHAGDADERDGDYFGTSVNRTARLLSAGHGGQILLSGYAADLAAGNLPSGITLRQLGMLPLRDFKEPERVYQPIAADLRAEFKALRALETPRNNLPQQTTSFVGRAQDVIRVERLLETEALVTIVGAGGMGKTRLALEAAAALLNDCSDGAWMVDLASISSEDLVTSAILSALDADQTSGAAPFDALLAYLTHRKLLLLLDNCEHVIAEVARVVAALVRRCPHVTILATSRSALDVGGEYVYRLASLDPMASAKLFEERARAADRAFSSELHRQEIEKICAGLDGIALAIELAAARIRTIPIQKLAEHLELRLLAGGRDRQARQQTMRALIDWSYDLLAPEEQIFLRRCAPCMAGFTLDSAMSLGAGADEVGALDLLSSLVDKSLLVSDADRVEPRYRLLEPIRQYAVELLDANGEKREALARHADVFAALAHERYREWETGPASDWLARSSTEVPNFRAALEWTLEGSNDLRLGARLAADTAPVFLRLSLLSEGVQWCELALRSNDDVEPALAARLRYGLSMLYSNQGQAGKVLDQARQAVALYREANDLRGLSRALSQVASRLATQTRYEEAQSAAREALQLARDFADRRLLADVLRRCAESFTLHGKAEVRANFSESVELFRSLGRDDETAIALMWWGQWEAKVEEYREAARRLTEAKRLAGEDTAMGVASDVVACHLLIGDRSDAKLVAREALELAVRFHHPIHTIFGIWYIAALAAEGDAVEAARLTGYAEERFRATDWRLVSYDLSIAANLHDALARQLGAAELALLLAEGAAWSEEEAVTRARTLWSKI
jgi:predicted ATPase/class 3 adenylate cyclase